MGKLHPNETFVGVAEGVKKRDNEEFRGRCAKAKGIVERMTKERLWDTVRAKDLPPYLIEFVERQIKHGIPFEMIRQNLGDHITPNSKIWSKIQSALLMGERVNRGSLLKREAQRFDEIAKRYHAMIVDAFENGTPVLDNQCNIQYMKGLTKELATNIKGYSDLIQGFARFGKDMGAFVDHEQRQQNGVTIVVQSPVTLPTAAEITAHQASRTITIGQPTTQPTQQPPKTHDEPKS